MANGNFPLGGEDSFLSYPLLWAPPAAYLSIVFMSIHHNFAVKPRRVRRQSPRGSLLWQTSS